MKIGELRGIFPELPKLQETKKSEESEFGDMLTSLVKNVNQDQIDSQKVTQDFVEGKDVELHEVMIAGEKAKTSLELLMEIRNKTVDMYKELTRMQI